MMPAHLTPEQKEHIRIARRAHLRIEETWSLFMMYLSQDKSPGEALELARDAVNVWADFMDSNHVEFPDIEEPSFADAIGEQMGKLIDKLPARSGPSGVLIFNADQSPESTGPAETSPATESSAQTQGESL